jgi:hypothetical protein
MLNTLKNIGKPQRMNASTFAYYTLYGEIPKIDIFGKKDNPMKKIDGIEIDEGIPVNSFKAIRRMSKIETKSVCRGWNETHPTYLIFKLLDKSNKSTVEKIVDNLNQMDNIKASYNIGNKGFYRICVTWYTWYRENDFELWWTELPKKIENSIKNI